MEYQKISLFKNNLYFRIKCKESDINATTVCTRCALDGGQGCSHEVDPLDGTIDAHVNLSSLVVRTAVRVIKENPNQEKVKINCPAKMDIILNA